VCDAVKRENKFWIDIKDTIEYSTAVKWLDTKETGKHYLAVATAILVLLIGKVVLEPETLRLRITLLAVLAYVVWFTIAQFFLMRKSSKRKK
jgi:hypothetical protein